MPTVRQAGKREGPKRAEVELVWTLVSTRATVNFCLQATAAGAHELACEFAAAMDSGAWETAVGVQVAMRWGAVESLRCQSFVGARLAMKDARRRLRVGPARAPGASP